MKVSRTERQKQIIKKWIDNSCMGGMECVTGFGKTFTSIQAIQIIKPKSIIVIVPTKDLKIQWLSKLKEFKILNYEVLIVNTAYKLKLHTDLLILDEAHNTGSAELFSLCWKNASFKKLLWLSATIERKDDYQKELLKIAPKVDEVKFEEALKNGWIANYTMYNVGLELNNDEDIEYSRIQYKLDKLYDDVAKSTNSSYEYVRQNIFKMASKFLKEGYPNVKYGAEYYKLIGQRKTLLYNANNKLLRTANYIKVNPDKKVLVFSQSQAFADKLQELVGDVGVTIHSGMSDKDREYNLKRFRDKRTKIRAIISVKALNEGIDVPELDVGICASGTSSKKDMVQMLGRIVRLNGDKKALFFNLYIKGTQDLYWLKNRQWDMDKSKIKWI